MSKLNGVAFTQAILLTGSDRVAMGSLEIGETFTLEADDAEAGEITDKTVGKVEVTLKGTKSTGKVSIYRVGSMLILPDGKTGTASKAKDGFNQVKIGATTVISNAETKDLGVVTLSKHLRKVDGGTNKISIANATFKVVGLVPVINRQSEEEGRRQLQYTYDSYVGFPDFEETMNDLDSDSEEFLTEFTKARRTVLSTDLKKDIEDHPDKVVNTPIVGVTFRK